MIEPTLTSFVFLFSWFLNMQTCVLHIFWRFFWFIHFTWFVGAAVQLHLLFFIPFPFWNWRLRFEYALQTSKFNRLQFFLLFVHCTQFESCSFISGFCTRSFPLSYFRMENESERKEDAYTIELYAIIFMRLIVHFGFRKQFWWYFNDLNACFRFSSYAFAGFSLFVCFLFSFINYLESDFFIILSDVLWCVASTWLCIEPRN